MESKTFDTSTLKGIQQAERYQTRLLGKYDVVTAKPVGLFRVLITGSNSKRKDA